MIPVAFDHLWVLLALPLAGLPFWGAARPRLAYPAQALLPSDRLSTFADISVRAVEALLIALLVLMLAGVHRPPQPLERIGQGAQMVLLLDRSRSMDQPFYSTNTRLEQALSEQRLRSKSRVASRLVSEFVARRDNDMFGLIVFSTYPIDVLALTRKREAVQAVIRAGEIGRGLANTDLGAALRSAVDFFDQQRYTGSRMIMLISDGAAELEFTVRSELRHLMERNRVSLYWIHIRSRNSPSIFDDIDLSVDAEIAPQVALHRFFQDLDIPYRAYSAENADALEKAIADVERLQSLPIRYRDVIPASDLTRPVAGLALALLTLSLIACMGEVYTWH
ncbi:MAG: VWA domain-containing protein [Gammaproteobacteria bacterium]|nr:VWA domain-containing protein [Gammaproteobacteria bacterium]